MPIIKTYDLLKNQEGKIVKRDLFIFLLPNPMPEGYGEGIDGLVKAMVNKTNEKYKEKVRKEFDEWLKFKKEMIKTDIPNIVIGENDYEEREISEWLNSTEINLNKKLNAIRENQSKRATLINILS